MDTFGDDWTAITGIVNNKNIDLSQYSNNHSLLNTSNDDNSYTTPNEIYNKQHIVDRTEENEEIIDRNDYENEDEFKKIIIENEEKKNEKYIKINTNNLYKYLFFILLMLVITYFFFTYRRKINTQFLFKT